MLPIRRIWESSFQVHKWGGNLTLGKLEKGLVRLGLNQLYKYFLGN